MLGRGRFLWVGRWGAREGQKASECEGWEDDEARGRRKQILGEGGVRCFGRVKTGGKGEKRGKVG